MNTLAPRPFWWRRPEARTILALFLVGLALRLVAAWHTNQIQPDSPARLAGDEFGYDGLAYWLTQGFFFNWPARPPVYPTMLAGFYLLFGHSYAAAIYAQAFVGATAVPLTYALARGYLPRGGAAVAAGLVAGDPALIWQVTRLYSEVLYTPLLLLALLLVRRAIAAPRMRQFVAAGAMLGVVNLCRPTALLLPALFVIMLPQSWPIARRLTATLIYGMAMLAVIAPWTYHNYRTYREFLPVSVSTAVLWQGSPEFYHLVERRIPILRIWEEQLNPQRNGGHDPFSIDGDRYFTARALASIRAEPTVYIRYCLQKAAYYWIGNPGIDWPSYTFFDVAELRRYFSPWRTLGFILARLFPLVTLCGVAILGRGMRPFLPLVVVCGYFTLVHAITYAEVRHSEPLHPFLAVITAAAVAKVVQIAIAPRQSPPRVARVAH